MFKDESFTAVAQDDNGVINALLIVFAVSLVVASLSYVIQHFIIIPLLESMLINIGGDVPTTTGFSPIELLTTVAAAVGIALVGIVLYTGLVRLFSGLLGAQKGTFPEMLAVFGHAYSVRAVGFIPFVSLASLVYFVAVSIKGLSVITGMSIGRSAAAYVIPALILTVIGIVVFVALIAYSFAAIW